MRFPLALAIALAAMAPAQQGPSDWQTAQTLPDVNLTGLSAAQKQAALKSLRVQSCTCGCEMHVAECRMKDPNCGISKAYAGLIVKAVREGKDPEKAVTESALYKAKSEPPKLLEDAVPMSIDGAPVKGAANARITLVEYSDFECPFCSRAAAKIEAILKAYPNDARLVYK